jgi:CspA family cold shock protein
MDDKKYVGTVVWFKPHPQGYGFIKWDNGSGDDTPDLFVHWSDIAIDGFKTLKKDDKVAFSIGKNKSNVDKAIKVVVIDSPSQTKK